MPNGGQRAQACWIHAKKCNVGIFVLRKQSEVGQMRRVRHRWCTFSLRTLLVGMLAVGCGLGWLLHERRRIAERRDTLEAACRAWSYDHDRQPAWRELLLGNDWPIYADFAEIGPSDRTTDIALTWLDDMPRLKMLSINNCPNITDDGVAHLASLTHLFWLDISVHADYR